MGEMEQKSNVIKVRKNIRSLLMSVDVHTSADHSSCRIIYYHVLFPIKSRGPTDSENHRMVILYQTCFNTASWTSLQTCGTYAIDPLACIDPWMSCVSPNIEFKRDDLPEPTWIQGHLLKEIIINKFISLQYSAQVERFLKKLW